jgi:hypothetical protein
MIALICLGLFICQVVTIFIPSLRPFSTFCGIAVIFCIVLLSIDDVGKLRKFK